jgi:alpha-tubulin suppressor-like RCC1 family protein
VALDNQGNVVAAGFTQNTGAFFDFTVAKFDRDGTVLWQQTLSTAANNNSLDDAHSVAVDREGTVIAAGRTGADFTVATFAR